MSDQLSFSDRKFLIDYGIAKIVIPFSGGNDEGGADDLEAYDENDKAIEIPKSDVHEDTVYDKTKRAWVVVGWIVTTYDTESRSWAKRPATDEEIRWAKLARRLEAPIYDQWGSFAGDFSVHGEVTWDISRGTCKVEGEESVYQGFSY